MTTIKEKVSLRQKNAQTILLRALKDTGASSPRNTPMIGSPKKNPDSPTHLISYVGAPDALLGLVTNTDELGPFVSAPVSMLGQLTPKLEFCFSSGAPPGGEDRGEIFNFSDHTLASNTKSLARSKITKNTTIKSVLEGRGTVGTDVGVQEFRWTWDNKHQGDRTIKAALTLYFGSIAELLNEEYLRFIFMSKDIPDIQAGNKKNSDSDRTTVEKDLQKRFRRMRQPRLALESRVNKELRQLKVAVGWSIPEKVKTNEYGWAPVHYEQFKSGVRATQKVISLQLISYKLNFGQEGQVTLNLEYVGSLDQIYSDDTAANIFSSPPNSPHKPEHHRYRLDNIIPVEPSWGNSINILRIGQEYFSDGVFKRKGNPEVMPVSDQSAEWGGLLFNRFNHFSSSNKNLPRSSWSIDVSIAECKYEKETLVKYLAYTEKWNAEDKERLDSIKAGLEAVDRIILELTSRSRNDIYNKFISNMFAEKRVLFYLIQTGLIDSDNPNPDNAAAPPPEPSDLDRRIALEAENKIGQANYAGGDPYEPTDDEARSLARLREWRAYQRRREILQNPASAHSDIYVAAQARLKLAIEADDERRNSEDKEFTEDNLKFLDPGTFEPPTGAKVRPGEMAVYYLRLGDIIGSALSGFERIEGFNSDVLLGSYSPASWGISGADPSESFPLASLPISLEYFSQWFIDNITSSNVIQMSFRNFVDRLLNKLVAPIINQTLLASSHAPKVSFEMTSITSPYQLEEKGPKAEKLGTLDTPQIKKIFVPNNKGYREDIIRTANYYYLAITSRHVDPAREGDNNVDEKEGIYHLVLGSDRGLVKTYSFSEKKMPFLRAMHIENNSKGSALILPQDVELTMVGNCIFRNGNIVYINADFAFGRTVASQLGLGGYYKVVKSDNVIRAGKFETRLTCMFERLAAPPTTQGAI